ncbi:MAG: mandelate racemase/muconate lactonizing enzyme family protein [Chloroflexota bacterium]
MKITNVTAYHLPGTRYPWVFLRVDTDEGIHGWGQASSGPHSDVVAAAASRLGPILIGQDPTRIEYIWHKLYASFNSLGSLGFVSALISGIDIALWDIRGKMLGLPIYELLGGKFHDNLILYSNGWFEGCETPEVRARGPTRRWTRATPRSSSTRSSGAPPTSRGTLPTTRRTRTTPPWTSSRRFAPRSATTSRSSSTRMAASTCRPPCASPTDCAHRIGWFEEPVPPENWDALKQFRDQTDVPICVGERLYTRWQFRPVLEQKLADYIMPDIIRTGGISEMKKIATLAETFFVPISPHDATGPITLIAGAQTMMSTSSFFRLEIAYSELRKYQQIMDPPFDVHDGYFHVSDAPGLGHEPRADYLEQGIPY